MDPDQSAFPRTPNVEPSQPGSVDPLLLTSGKAVASGLARGPEMPPGQTVSGLAW